MSQNDVTEVQVETNGNMTSSETPSWLAIACIMSSQTFATKLTPTDLFFPIGRRWARYWVGRISEISGIF